MAHCLVCGGRGILQVVVIKREARQTVPVRHKLPRCLIIACYSRFSIGEFDIIAIIRWFNVGSTVDLSVPGYTSKHYKLFLLVCSQVQIAPPTSFFFFLENSKDEGGGGDGNVASLIVERKASKPVAGFAASLLSRGALLFGSAYRRPTLATAAAAAAVRTPRRLLLSFWFWDFDFLLQCCVFKPVRICLLCDQPFQLVVDGVVPVLGM